MVCNVILKETLLVRMNFHGLFGAMMGERGGAAGYSYANPYEQAAYSDSRSN